MAIPRYNLQYNIIFYLFISRFSFPSHVCRKLQQRINCIIPVTLSAGGPLFFLRDSGYDHKTPKEDYITIINLLYLLCVSRSNRSIFSGNNLSLYMRASASASTFLAKTDTNLSYNLLLPLYYLALSTILWFPLSIPCG